MKSIVIVPQKREFDCAQVAIKTVVKRVTIKISSSKSSWSYITNIGTLNFLGIANSALRQNAMNTRLRHKEDQRENRGAVYMVG